MRKAYLVAAIAWAAATGCRAPASDNAMIQSSSPDERIKAVVRFGEARDPDAVPLLVDRLEDEDPAVRMLAGQALKRITGETHDWRHYDSANRRAEAVERWRAWLRHGGVGGTSRPATRLAGSS